MTLWPGHGMRNSPWLPPAPPRLHTATLHTFLEFPTSLLPFTRVLRTSKVETAIAEREKQKRMVELGAEKSLIVERDAKGRVIKTGGAHFAPPK